VKIFKAIISSLKNSKIHIILFFILSIIVAYTTTYIPVIIQNFLDILLHQNITNNWVMEYATNILNDKLSFISIACIVLFIIEIIVVISTYLRTIIKNKIIQDFQFEFKLKLFNYIQNLTYQDFYQKSLAELVQNMADDVNNIVKFLEKQFTYILDIILIIFFAIIVILSSYTSIYGSSTLYTWSPSSSLLETVSDTETDLKLESDGAILIEQSTGSVLYEHNAHERFRPASVTKVMSLLLIMEAIDNRWA